MYREVLQQIGLHKNEAQIYEALVSLGAATISDISRVSKVNRRNVYDSIKKLQEKGLIIASGRPDEHRYKAAEPGRLMRILQTQKQALSSLLPDLNASYRRHVPEEQALVSRGSEGTKNFWRFVTSQTERVLFIGGKGAWHDPSINEERKLYFQECKRRKIPVQGLFDHEVLVRGRDMYSEYDPALIRFIPPEYSTKASMDICADRILFFGMPRERKIENTTIYNLISLPLANSFRIWFDHLWRLAQPLRKT